MRFSQRMGIRPATVAFQKDFVSDDLRNALWNAVYETYLVDHDKPSKMEATSLMTLAKLTERDFFKNRIDEIPDFSDDYVALTKNRLYKGEWTDVYDLVEWFGSFGENYTWWQEGNSHFDRAEKFRSYVNTVLTEENSAYRFIGFTLVHISSTVEVDAIESAMTDEISASNVSRHIEAGLKLLSDRQSPDFRNSIKEAISAVEAAARIIAGNSKATLGDALNQLERAGHLHPALKKAFTSIYGYTSTADGIRHAMMDEPVLSLADARLMLVLCSGFANYLLDRNRN